MTWKGIVENLGSQSPITFQMMKRSHCIHWSPLIVKSKSCWNPLWMLNVTFIQVHQILWHLHCSLWSWTSFKSHGFQHCLLDFLESFTLSNLTLEFRRCFEIWRACLKREGEGEDYAAEKKHFVAAHRSTEKWQFVSIVWQHGYLKQSKCA